jgi:hypothetical protein
MFYIDVAKVDQDVAHVAMVFSSVCPKCFIYFKHTLQVFHLDVAKVDLNIAYTCMLQAFQGFHTYVASVLSGRCICFAMAINMFFLVFQTYVASVSNISNVCCKCFI